MRIDASNENNRIILSVFIIIVTVFIAFSPSLKNNFITSWDDETYVTGNDSIKQLSAQNIGKIFTSSCLGNYQPITILTYALEYHFFELKAQYYHATNILIHILNCLLVFWLIMLISARIPVALVTALLFGLHPLRVESVTWIAERKDVLYSFFFLWALISYICYITKGQKKEYYYQALLLFFFSLLSKAMAVMLPVVFFLFDYLLNRKPGKKLLTEKIPFFVIALIFGIIAIVAQRKDEAIAIGKQFDLVRQVFSGFYGIGFYLNKTIFPVNLSAIYPYPPKNGLFYAASIFSAAIVLMIGGAVFFLKRFTKKIIFGSLFSFFTILPVLQFLPVGQAIAADRYTYLPSIGIFYMISEGLFHIWRIKYRYQNIFKAAEIAFLIVVITTLGFLTYERTGIWRDDSILWSDVLKSYPEFPVAHANRGVQYEKQGNLDAAIVEYDKAIQFKVPNPGKVYCDRGNAYYSKGDIDRALSDYNKAIEVSPRYRDAYNNRAVIHYLKNDYDKAWEDVHKVEALGGKFNLKLLDELKRVSGRDQ